MKAIKYITLALAAASLAACSDINSQLPEGNELTAEQYNDLKDQYPIRKEAVFNSMYTMMGEPDFTFKRGSESYRADDFGFITMALSNDVEGPDAWFPNSGYNWFSVCGELSSRNPDYANPNIRYMSPYNQIGIANQVITSVYDGLTDGQVTEDDAVILAQAHAVRAFDYLSLAPYFQFKYVGNEKKACVPVVSETTSDYLNNPRQTVDSVYRFILSDLDFAVDTLGKYNYEPDGDKTRVGLMVALGLRARAYMNMEKWSEALADADRVLELAADNGITPADSTELLTPGFCDISSSNWLWGINVSNAQAQKGAYASAASWISSLSGNGYTAGAGCYLHVNPLLYNKISDTDVRKQWWLNEDLESKMLDNITWNGYTGEALPEAQIPDVKEPMDAFTNLKFGCFKGTGSTSNEGAYPLMRIEEIYLIKAEAMQHVSSDGLSWLATNFITKYRDASWSQTCKDPLDEIWFQRRIELWGEGFGMGDIMRLGKDVVRVKNVDNEYYPTAFSFNIKHDDPWLLMRFCTQETNQNKGIVNNTGGSQPKSGDNTQPKSNNLTDGVTD